MEAFWLQIEVATRVTRPLQLDFSVLLQGTFLFFSGSGEVLLEFGDEMLELGCVLLEFDGVMLEFRELCSSWDFGTERLHAKYHLPHKRFKFVKGIQREWRFGF